MDDASLAAALRALALTVDVTALRWLVGEIERRIAIPRRPCMARPRDAAPLPAADSGNEPCSAAPIGMAGDGT